MVREWARQTVHIVIGLLFALLASLVSQQVFLIVTFSVLVCGFLLAKSGFAFVSRIEKVLDRDEVIRGRGAYLMLFGVGLTAMLFPAQLVYALLVLAISDSLATVIGYYYGKHTLAWNSSSTYEGSLAFFVSSAIILIPFGSIGVVCAVVVTGVESLDYDPFTYLDDNVMVPLSTGLLLFMISVL
jgi:dolichol kinase